MAKHASVPNVKAGTEIHRKAVKNLAGSGCVYVRMTSDIFTTVISSDSSDDLPKVHHLFLLPVKQLKFV